MPGAAVAGEVAAVGERLRRVDGAGAVGGARLHRHLAPPQPHRALHHSRRLKVSVLHAVCFKWDRLSGTISKIPKNVWDT